MFSMNVSLFLNMGVNLLLDLESQYMHSLSVWAILEKRSCNCVNVLPAAPDQTWKRGETIINKCSNPFFFRNFFSFNNSVRENLFPFSKSDTELLFLWPLFDQRGLKGKALLYWTIDRCRSKENWSNLNGYKKNKTWAQTYYLYHLWNLGNRKGEAILNWYPKPVLFLS